MTRVYPELWFNRGDLSSTLLKVLPDGRLTMAINGDNNMPLVTMTLYGRNYHLDGPIPEQYCPQDHIHVPEEIVKNDEL